MQMVNSVNFIHFLHALLSESMSRFIVLVGFTVVMPGCCQPGAGRRSRRNTTVRRAQLV